MTPNEIILDIINQKLCDLIDGFSTNEFVEECGDQIHKLTGETLSDDDVKNIIGGKVTPLFEHLGKWVSEKK